MQQFPRGGVRSPVAGTWRAARAVAHEVGVAAADGQPLGSVAAGAVCLLQSSHNSPPRQWGRTSRILRGPSRSHPSGSSITLIQGLGRGPCSPAVATATASLTARTREGAAGCPEKESPWVASIQVTRSSQKLPVRAEKLRGARSKTCLATSEDLSAASPPRSPRYLRSLEPEVGGRAAKAVSD
jgi:hypothetical protein